jgi:uncharacterized protein DUF3562
MQKSGNSQDLSSRESDIERLARETDTPVDIVHELYTIEHAKLDRVARIKTYVPLLTRRHVKALLQTNRAA